MAALLLAYLNDATKPPEFYARAAAASAEAMLLRGFTSVRDMGGPIFPIKDAIDSGRAVGRRIWPSGATISQTAGHGDCRAPQEKSRRFGGEASRAELLDATSSLRTRSEPKRKVLAGSSVC